MKKIIKSPMGKILKSIRGAIPWIKSNHKTLVALVLTLAASIISPSVVGDAPIGGEVISR